MRIILIGFGVVGQSFLRIIQLRESELFDNYGFRPKIVAIVDKGGAAINHKGLHLTDLLTLKLETGTVASILKYGYPEMRAMNVIESLEAEVIIETTPTNIKDGEPGLSHIKSAFKTGKHVVTTNKGPLALALPALTELAEYNNVYLRFSGTVGAGTPVLELAKKCLVGDIITSIKGVLNGTTNYILTEMDQKHLTFRQSLRATQKLGYAEADPSMDVDGLDVACKLVIIANWVLDKKVTLKDVAIKGIRGVTLQDLKTASQNNCTIKLLGSANDKLTVCPTLISRRDPLAVDGVLNAVTFVSKFAGNQTIIGRGAGGLETASTVVRDLLNIKHNLATKMLD